MRNSANPESQFYKLEKVVNEYWPLFKEGKIGRTEIKADLKNQLKPNEIQFVIDELSERHLNGFKGGDVIKNIQSAESKTGAYLYLILGLGLVLIGIVLTWLFWQAGWIVFLTLFMISTGVMIIFKSNRKITNLSQSRD